MWFLRSGPRIQEIPLNRILSNPYQPRKEVREEGLQHLMQSIAENGLIVPIIVRRLDRGRNFELVAGQRRVQACRRLNWKRIPALVRSLSDRDVTQVSLLENLQRAELSAVEVAESFERLVRDYVQVGREDLARKLGLDPKEVASQGQLLSLSVVTREAVMTGLITERHAQAMLALSREEDQIRVLKQVHKEDLSVRQTKMLVQQVLSERERPPSAPGSAPAGVGTTEGPLVGRLEGELGKLLAGNGFHTEALEAIVRELGQGLDLDAAGALAFPEETSAVAEGGSVERHMLRAARVSLWVARHAGWSAERLQQVGVAALLYDVGLRRVDPQLLSRRGPLSPAEQILVRRHVSHGEEILSRLTGLDPDVRAGVLQHHERFDGSGYLNGLRERGIHPVAQLIGMADAYVAMCERRPHRDGYTPYRALKVLQIETERGAHDPELLGRFIAALSLYPVGSRVVLSDNRVGVVARPGAAPVRPVVR
ncbi:MAG: ParB/RepB/Spo0J family partition protein, partial [Planctomycetes bacterium]|nr:ParB/RepB/Spo0J family partition protein [Planctomycetota bacterium]